MQGLSFTGFLESAIIGSTLPNLRRLSLGPPPFHWEAVVPLKALDSVEELRIAGAPLIESEIELIGRMPRLRKLEWTVVTCYPSEMDPK